MQLLKSALSFLFVLTVFAFFSGAQDTLKQPPRQESPTKDAQMKEDPNRDFDAHMAKFQQSYRKMKSQENGVKDPKMKADMQTLITKMDKVVNDYNAMNNNTALTEQQKQESRKRIQSEMKEVRKMRDDMKAKYGDEMGGKAKKSQEQKTPPEKSDSYPE